MNLQNFKVQEHTIKEFTEMCKRLESAFSESPSTEQTNKGSSNNIRNVFGTTTTETEKINYIVY